MLSFLPPAPSLIVCGCMMAVNLSVVGSGPIRWPGKSLCEYVRGRECAYVVWVFMWVGMRAKNRREDREEGS